MSLWKLETRWWIAFCQWRKFHKLIPTSTGCERAFQNFELIRFVQFFLIGNLYCKGTDAGSLYLKQIRGVNNSQGRTAVHNCWFSSFSFAAKGRGRYQPHLIKSRKKTHLQIDLKRIKTTCILLKDCLSKVSLSQPDRERWWSLGKFASTRYQSF